MSLTIVQTIDYEKKARKGTQHKSSGKHTAESLDNFEDSMILVGKVEKVMITKIKITKQFSEDVLELIFQHYPSIKHAWKTRTREDSKSELRKVMRELLNELQYELHVSE